MDVFLGKGKRRFRNWLVWPSGPRFCFWNWTLEARQKLGKMYILCTWNITLRANAYFLGFFFSITLHCLASCSFLLLLTQHDKLWQDEPVNLPRSVDDLLSDYAKRFHEIKTPRKLLWKKNLGVVKVCQFQFTTLYDFPALMLSGCFLLMLSPIFFILSIFAFSLCSSLFFSWNYNLKIKLSSFLSLHFLQQLLCNFRTKPGKRLLYLLYLLYQ